MIVTLFGGLLSAIGAQLVVVAARWFGRGRFFPRSGIAVRWLPTLVLGVLGDAFLVAGVSVLLVSMRV